MAAENTAKPSGRGAKTTNSRSRAARVPESPVTPAKAEPTVEASASQADDSSVLAASDSKASPSNSGDAMSPDNNVVQMSTRPAQADDKKKKSAIQLHQSPLDLHKLPAMSSEIQVAETMSVAGVRPIETSHLALVGSYLNGRPISASSLKVSEMLPGDRPIFSSEFRMVEGAMLPGNRPIMASDPELLAASILPGNRPIASNDVVDPDPAALMGYLD